VNLDANELAAKHAESAFPLNGGNQLSYLDGELEVVETSNAAAYA
jgi:hypothetical protein